MGNEYPSALRSHSRIRLSFVPLLLRYNNKQQHASVTGNPIRRKRLDFSSCSDFTAYLRTKGDPHPARADTAAAAAAGGGGKVGSSSNSSNKRGVGSSSNVAKASLMSEGAAAEAKVAEELKKTIASGVHYGVLSLVNNKNTGSGGSTTKGGRSPRAASSSSSSFSSAQTGAGAADASCLCEIPSEVIPVHKLFILSGY
jgi:hypothetical protein